jgi:hypothetical protein
MTSGRANLSLELEREVFEIAAAANRKSIPTLLLVAHRVHEWYEFSTE